MRPQSLHLTPQSLKVLLEAMPAAVGILDGGALVYVNTAFAYAFGYRSAAELIEAGGLDALLADGAALAQPNGAARSAPVDALTRSRRKLRVAFAVVPLDPERDVKLLRLIDQASLDEETAPTSSARRRRRSRRLWRRSRRAPRPTPAAASTFSPRSVTRCARRSTRSSALPS